MDAGARTDPSVVPLPGGGCFGYASYGDPDGLPVLALHGTPACRLMFALADEEARRAGLHLVAPDRPGYGLTPPDIEPTLQSRTRWLAGAAAALKLQRFAILGISGGAPYAVALAAHIPQRISLLALVSPMGPVADYANVALSPPLPFVQRSFFLGISQNRLVSRAGGALLARAGRAMPSQLTGAGSRFAGDADAKILRRPDVRKKFAAMTREAFRQGAYGATSDFRIFGAPWRTDFTRITMPAVIWQGTMDRIVPVAAAEHLALLIPHARLVRLRGAGHFWVVTHMREVLDEIKSLAVTDR